MSAPTRKHSAPLDWLIPAILTGSAAPFVLLVFKAATGRLGANPIATALNQLGLLALIFLVACLACTPAKILFGVAWPIRIRKTLGLLAFYTACAHFFLYAAVDQGLRLGSVLTDVVKRPFILVGFVALVLLVPLAATSTKAALTRLGFKRWKRLHRLVYLIAILAAIHFRMRVKADAREPFVWLAIVAVLLLVRLIDGFRGGARARKKRSVMAAS
ncbi:MAG TPA: protein-methionine-sulfoxide reductase heme-binding subunit MsrQ [Polyangiaceae bacterium]|jgi:sulfoxide reductase heme-binding subunit YedZ|nr:protein-methionine-sulfoxide reductase heme-binding subunit MsrQ [Polyangiaceae bacterium]